MAIIAYKEEFLLYINIPFAKVDILKDRLVKAKFKIGKDVDMGDEHEIGVWVIPEIAYKAVEIMKSVSDTAIDTGGMDAQSRSVLKYYKEGGELSGFEGVHGYLCSEGYLDTDLNLTEKGKNFIKEYKYWAFVEAYVNPVYIKIK